MILLTFHWGPLTKPYLFLLAVCVTLRPLTVTESACAVTTLHIYCKGKSMQSCTESTHLMLFRVKCASCESQGDRQREYKVFIIVSLPSVSQLFRGFHTPPAPCPSISLQNMNPRTPSSGNQLIYLNWQICIYCHLAILVMNTNHLLIDHCFVCAWKYIAPYITFGSYSCIVIVLAVLWEQALLVMLWGYSVHFYKV